MALQKGEPNVARLYMSPCTVRALNLDAKGTTPALATKPITSSICASYMHCQTRHRHKQTYISPLPSPILLETTWTGLNWAMLLMVGGSALCLCVLSCHNAYVEGHTLTRVSKLSKYWQELHSFVALKATQSFDCPDHTRP